MRGSFQSYLTGIETIVGVLNNGIGRTSNRTLQELKLIWSASAKSVQPSSNRTLQELKPYT